MLLPTKNRDGIFMCEFLLVGAERAVPYRADAEQAYCTNRTHLHGGMNTNLHTSNDPSCCKDTLNLSG